MLSVGYTLKGYLIPGMDTETDGAVAQLGERDNRTVEVRGSIPLCSTLPVELDWRDRTRGECEGTVSPHVWGRPGSKATDRRGRAPSYGANAVSDGSFPLCSTVCPLSPFVR